MEILLYVGGDETRTQAFLQQLRERLPASRVRVWQAGDDAPADYALVFRPPVELLKQRAGLKAVIYLAAGVEYLTGMLRQDPTLIPADVPVLRMEDAGMGRQMEEYAAYNVLRFFRRMHDYDAARRAGRWQKLPPEDIATFHVGVAGLGVLGQRVARAVARLGFPVRGWSRSEKSVDGIQCLAGEAQLPRFLDGLRVVINLLPLTPETADTLDKQWFSAMTAPAYVINIGRGPHLVDADLLDAIRAGQIGGAALDVFREEPLPASHPFWDEPRIDITPHIAAVTLSNEGVAQVVEKLTLLRDGTAVTGLVDRARGY
ncbi:glyoxylate/hydroxypyruvate reductase A [Bordetella sp. N]|uniref:2-hydroxyacid dehydrogenase n=1 Tax=Bordetella sp. N TaxID=1746199 RepID=UPI000708C8B3|nr:glyoxylate/hydroxypyruvate reductase A [Bordetella sp. N]ALM86084.1 glyoxylate/hydroxypyruvate reductase A [Bordetella sp. N]